MAEIQVAAIDFLAVVAIGALGILGACATILIGKIKQRLQVEIDDLNDKSLRDYLNGALKQLDDVTNKTVLKIEETAAKKIRMAVRDGSADRSELEALANEAYDEIVSTMNPDYMNFIQSALGDAETYIKNLIEQKLFAIKNYNPY